LQGHAEPPLLLRHARSFWTGWPGMTASVNS
jgi:hypothetical protein